MLVAGHPFTSRHDATLWLTARVLSFDVEVPIMRIVSAYWHYGRVWNVRADIALAQACKETGWFGYGGDVQPNQNNYAGIGATGGVPGLTFPTVEAGVAAHVLRMAMYSIGDESLYDLATLVRPLPRKHWGEYPHIQDYNGVWAVPGDGYGEWIAAVAAGMRVFAERRS